MDRTYILHRIYTSEDVHKGHYFDRVVKMQQPLGGPAIYGISSVWTVY